MSSPSSPAHVIRLRGPWTLTPLDPPGESVVRHLPGDGKLPFGDAYRGRVLCERRFGRPTNLDPDERVMLIVERPRFRAEVALNTAPLGMLEFLASGAYEASERLRERNVLSITLDQTTDDRPGEMIFEARLEIRRIR